ncbi:MAG: hypothetical protein RL701_4797 [Pseudomonadota bacterium]
MLFRQLFDQDSSTYSYLLADEKSREAVLIDPVIEQFDRDRTLIEELQLKLVYILDTHVHADHVTGSGLLREHFGAKSVVSERAGVVCSDRQVKQGDRIHFGRHELEVRETPGHTNGCLSFVCAEARMVFTGDALLIRACGRTDFQQGDASTLYRSVHEQIFTLPADTTVYPAHDYKGRMASSVDEERRLNRRLGQDKSLTDFIQIMSELKLPYPRKIDASLPANARCGLLQASEPTVPDLANDWAPLELSPVGVPEISTQALRQLDPNAAALIGCARAGRVSRRARPHRWQPACASRNTPRGRARMAQGATGRGDLPVGWALRAGCHAACSCGLPASRFAQRWHDELDRSKPADRARLHRGTTRLRSDSCNSCVRRHV